MVSEKIVDTISELYMLLNERPFRHILAKQKNIGQLFPTFPDRVAAVESAELYEETPGLWHFKVDSVTTPNVDYWDVYIQFRDIVLKIREYGKRREQWKSDGSGIDLDKLANRIMTNADMRVWCSCLTGDTKVPLLDGRVLTMEELLLEYGTEREFWVYASDEKGDFVPAKARCLGKTGSVSDLIQVVLDNGESIKCTPDHRFRMRDGAYKEAKDLRSGDSLMPLYRQINSYGYEYVKSNSDGNWNPTHKLIAESILKNEIDKIEGKYNTHHIDENKVNNSPDKLEPMSAKDHWRMHQNQAGFRLRLWERSVRGSQSLRIITSKKGRTCWEKHSAENLANLRNGAKAYQNSIKGKEAMKLEMKRRWQDAGIREKLGSGKSKPWSEERKANHKASLQGLDRSKLSERVALLNKTVVRDASGHNNHKVAGIIRIVHDNALPVYDLSVEKYGNFALQVGVFVHNCPSNQFWGFAYIQTTHQTKYGDPENRKPRVRNPNQRGSGCKHLQKVFDRLPSLKSTLAGHLKRFFADDIKSIEKEVEHERAKFKAAADILRKKEREKEDQLSYTRGGKPIKRGRR